MKHDEPKPSLADILAEDELQGVDAQLASVVAELPDSVLPESFTDSVMEKLVLGEARHKRAWRQSALIAASVALVVLAGMVAWNPFAEQKSPSELEIASISAEMMDAYDFQSESLDTLVYGASAAEAMPDMADVLYTDPMVSLVGF